MNAVLKGGIAAGLVGGALDLLAASVIYPLMEGFPAIRVPQSIASGVMGAAAYEGGVATALLGTGLHFLIALFAGLALAAGMSLYEPLRRMAFATGAVFGAAMYVFMNYVVVPVSRAVVGEPDATRIAIGVLIHLFLFGVPMAYVARRFLTAKG
ncbi:hypothetical protein [Amphiplicatus metriothermophilus]|uniref:DUF1440 domain-containing protein n=1 Tax=Amphiplicatus metriothermophilus TaxID=1519374 RepID=A0A239Q0H8_9PROT|nr:hypothetical protein [Amphiplicatus metriothermophilus]MBB5519731.1 putative membrane protein YagU involved in acid resistance [Amphiplicatus metriothermophilus]SNT75930.1 hypothetical protein SAMN06297382_2995 [Amphiplicatus metriothermophilus]